MFFELMNEGLKLQSYHVVGYSAGGIFACCYAHMYGKLKSVRSSIFISSVGACDTPNATAEMPFLFKTMWYLVSNHKKLAKIGISFDQSKYRRNPIDATVEGFKVYGEPTKTQIKQPNILRYFLINGYEAISNEHGEMSDCREILLYGEKWKFSMSEVVCPVIIYHGTADTGCVPAMAKHLYQLITGVEAPPVPLYKPSEDEDETDEDGVEKEKEEKEEEKEKKEEQQTEEKKKEENTKPTAEEKHKQRTT